MARILVVDDEQDLCEVLRFNFESENFEVVTANAAEEALDMIENRGERFALILLDVMMETMSGFELAKRLRDKGNNVPIIFLTALSAESQQLQGFGVGADDYVTKPFSFQTVLARVRAVLKRSDPANSVAPFAPVDSSAPAFPPNLTRKEHLILQLLSQHPGQYFTREQILEAVWEEGTYVGDRSVDVHIARLRKKMGEEGARIGNRTGFGYYYK